MLKLIILVHVCFTVDTLRQYAEYSDSLRCPPQQTKGRYYCQVSGYKSLRLLFSSGEYVSTIATKTGNGKNDGSGCRAVMEICDSLGNCCRTSPDGRGLYKGYRNLGQIDEHTDKTILGSCAETVILFSTLIPIQRWQTPPILSPGELGWFPHHSQIDKQRPGRRWRWYHSKCNWTDLIAQCNAFEKKYTCKCLRNFV